MVVPNYVLLLIAIPLFFVFRHFFNNYFANKRMYQLLAETNTDRTALILDYAEFRGDPCLNLISPEIVYKVTELLLKSGELAQLFHAYDLLSTIKIACYDTVGTDNEKVKYKKYEYMNHKVQIQFAEYTMYMEKIKSALRLSGMTEEQLTEFSHKYVPTEDDFFAYAKQLVDTHSDVRLLFDTIK